MRACVDAAAVSLSSLSRSSVYRSSHSPPQSVRRTTQSSWLKMKPFIALMSRALVGRAARVCSRPAATNCRRRRRRPGWITHRPSSSSPPVVVSQSPVPRSRQSARPALSPPASYLIARPATSPSRRHFSSSPASGRRPRSSSLTRSRELRPARVTRPRLPSRPTRDGRTAKQWRAAAAQLRRTTFEGARRDGSAGRGGWTGR